MACKRRRTWTRDQLVAAIRESTTRREVLGKLGLKQAGGNYTQLRKYILELGLDTSHFREFPYTRGMKIHRPPRPIEEVLVENIFVQSYKLKQRLFRLGLKAQKCEECGWAQSTPDGYLPLELDHINGNPLDNRLENLRILCPNCHSLKPTHRGRNKKRKSA